MPNWILPIFQLSPGHLIVASGFITVLLAVKNCEERAQRRRWIRNGLWMVIVGLVVSVAYDLGLRDLARAAIERMA